MLNTISWVLGVLVTIGIIITGKAASKGHVPLDVDGYPIAPQDLELEQVHVYVRHGEYK